MADVPDSFHRAEADCDVPAAQAYVFLCDGIALGRWALGCWATEPDVLGTVRGHSLFDGQPGWVRAEGDAARLAIAYHVGGAPDRLQPRIHAQVLPGEALGMGPGRCRVRLDAARTPDMDDARWLRLVRCHEVEVLLIQAQLAR